MFKVAVGHSNDPDSDCAIAEVLEQCQKSLAGKIPNAGILFAAIDFDHNLILQEIDQVFPGIELIGGTTDGEISSVLGFEQDSLTLTVFCTDNTNLKILAGIGENVSLNPVAATSRAVEQALSKSSNLAATICLTIPETLGSSGVSILNGLKLALGQQVPIFGGLAADQNRFQQTYQFFKTKVFSDSVPVLLFCGELLFSHGVASGWNPIGKKSLVTSADKHIVYEIDGEPALHFYHRYLGSLTPAAEYPLAIYGDVTEQFYMRAPKTHDSSNGSITFFADVPNQALVQITQASCDDILTASKISMTNALENYPGVEPKVVLFFSCASRRQILGTRAREEYQIAKSCLKIELPCCGFYANGEISPNSGSNWTYFHNETFVTLMLGEK
ncbi:FIST signal transduction protein [Mastigocoleus testarum]|uniref:Histidine kinase n=1 Tax=Mastigocoleus testarum BC008 TaxID=371196 RepID=A0A0V7ZKH4_9CYAN|nr:FIST N-terminal domain-containing protein [Mastigocoleus testarum]KST62798.1 hypothetical protein BC008_10755 [Mastigocoleus testarum BC008]KST65109.1 hypothetical protein BC008_20115 [Mastigocoleus testarum BC008]